ncbi:WD40 repeat domain-containing protein [Streptomyces wuyuanensis]|uniref:WD40 repeat domain-containing protein n=1 Tax=Streptomyces wuyuanensis TaxID=1196353 RepID=UPI0037FA1D7A
MDALTAHALAPDAPESRNALLSAANREAGIKKVVRTTAKGLHSLALDRQGRYVAGIDGQRRLRIWDMRKASPVAVPAGLDEVNAVAFPKTRGALAVATDHGTARWDPATTRTAQWRTKTAATAVAYSADGARLAVGGRDGTVEVGDTASAATVRRVRLTGGGPTTLTFGPSGTTLAIGTADTVHLWNWRATARPRHSATDIDSPVRSLFHVSSCRCFYAASGSRLHFLAEGTAKAVRAPVSVPNGSVAAHSGSSLYVAAANAILVFSADPEELTDAEGKRATASDVIGRGGGSRARLSVSGDGKTLVTPPSSGALILYDLEGPDTAKPWMPGLASVDRIPGSNSLLYVTGAYGKATAAIYDPRAGKGSRKLLDLGPVLGKDSSDFSPRLLLLAAAGEDGLIKLHRVQASATTFDALTPLSGPSGQRAVTAVFDDTRKELYAGWNHEIRVYGMSQPTRPKLLYKVGLPDTEQVLAVGPAAGHANLFVATHRGLYALPYLSGRYTWSQRTLLASGVYIRAIPLKDGGAVGSTLTGSLSVYHKRDDTWSELPLAGRAPATGTVRTYGREIVVAAMQHITVFDGETGAQIIDLRVRGVLPTALSYDGASVRVYEDVSTVTFPLGQEAVLTRACAMLGSSAPASVADVWPEAPQAVRDQSLCPR